MHRATTSEGLEVMINGPLALNPAEPGALTWLAKVGPYGVASVKLNCEHAQVAVLRDMQFSADDPHVQQNLSAKLLASIADYAREHGVLKMKVHRNSRFDWIPRQLAHHGFSDAASGRDQMQFYLDIYKPIRKLHGLPAHRRESIKMAC